MSNGERLAQLMSRIDCRGGHTQIGKILAHARQETERARVQAVVFIGAVGGWTVYRNALAEADAFFDYHLRQTALILKNQPVEYYLLRPQIIAPDDAAYDFVVQVWTLDGLRVYLSHPHAVLPAITTIGFSTGRAPSAIERMQADLFVPPRLAPMTPSFRLWRSSVTVEELTSTVARYLGGPPVVKQAWDSDAADVTVVLGSDRSHLRLE